MPNHADGIMGNIQGVPRNMRVARQFNSLNKSFCSKVQVHNHKIQNLGISNMCAAFLCFQYSRRYKIFRSDFDNFRYI